MSYEISAEEYQDDFPRGVKRIIENTMTALVIMGLTPDEAQEAMERKFPSLIVEKETE